MKIIMQIADKISAKNDTGFANKPRPFVQVRMLANISGSRMVLIKPNKLLTIFLREFSSAVKFDINERLSSPVSLSSAKSIHGHMIVAVAVIPINKK